jgi:ABC-type enterochelin transport system ATPase subunit
MLRDGRLFDQGAKEDLLAEGRLSELFGWKMEVERANGFYGTRLR